MLPSKPPIATHSIQHTPSRIVNNSELIIRPPKNADLDALITLEENNFSGDRISKRRFKHWLKASNGLMLVAFRNDALVGYGLVLLHKGTRLARLYSLVIDKNQRGQGLGQQLLDQLEHGAAQRKRLFMRLEVAKHNAAAIILYRRSGYHIFGEYTDYYEDHSDALRMQKRIRYPNAAQVSRQIPWYRQTTDFTCGPASLIMAMASLDEDVVVNQELELDIWREATTIFMTSGHGGCHPLGLALAADKRDFDACVYISTNKPLFLEGVRSEHKKSVMMAVDRQFLEKAKQCNIELHYADLSQQQIQSWLSDGYAVIILISTYRMDGRKVPHWVTVTAMDESCLYVHDSDPDNDNQDQDALDCQHIPIARDDFVKMSQFGTERLRTAIAIKKKNKPNVCTNLSRSPN
jgi:ribosomal protein S18 acetylase RimI-like enzyme